MENEKTFYRCVIPCGTSMETAKEIYKRLKNQGWAVELESLTDITEESEEE